MTKNVVVCCDGTSNEFKKNRTNVAKLCLTLLQKPGVQEVFYHPGLGTMEPPGALTSVSVWVTKLLGLAIGYGLKNDIRDAYVFLMNHAEPGDRAFIFGFSRGAYTARALTGLLHMYGLLRPGNEPLVPYAIRMMFGVNTLPKTAGGKPGRQSAQDFFQLAAEFKRTFSVACKPAFVGLWDTVNSVGLMSQAFHVPYTANNPDIAVARHALALNEVRGFFRPNPWYPKADPAFAAGPKDLMQVWFAGCHSDVGGGFAEPESGAAKCALEWMIAEAAGHGLLFMPERVREMLGAPGPYYAPVYIKPDPRGRLHNSMTGFWPLLEFVPKKRYDPVTKRWKWRINLFAWRPVPDDALVHESVFARGEAYRKHCRNFPKHPKIVHTKPVPELGIKDPEDGE